MTIRAVATSPPVAAIASATASTDAVVRPDTREEPPRAGSPRARNGDLTAHAERQTCLPGGAQGPDEAPGSPGVSETAQGLRLPGEQHPERWRGDLIPDAPAGQRRGPAAAAEKGACTLYDVKDLH